MSAATQSAIYAPPGMVPRDTPLGSPLPPRGKRGPAIPRERLEYVAQAWIRGAPAFEIEDECARRFGVTVRQARRYIAKVRMRAARLQLDITSDEWRAECTRLLEASYAVAREGTVTTRPDGTTEHRRDARTMALVADRLAVLHGANRPVHVVVEQAKHGVAREIAEALARELDPETFAKVLEVVERKALNGPVSSAAVVTVNGSVSGTVNEESE